MEKYIVDVLILVAMLKIGIGILKFLFSANVRKRSAVYYRIKKILSNWICIPLDKIIAKQEKKTASKKKLPKSRKVVKLPNAK